LLATRTLLQTLSVAFATDGVGRQHNQGGLPGLLSASENAEGFTSEIKVTRDFSTDGNVNTKKTNRDQKQHEVVLQTPSEQCSEMRTETGLAYKLFETFSGVLFTLERGLPLR
jgi:hypothetical protein